MLQTLGSGAADDGSDGPPLSGHQLGQVKQLLLFLSGPFCLLDAGIQPLVPAGRSTARLYDSDLNKSAPLKNAGNTNPQ